MEGQRLLQSLECGVQGANGQLSDGAGIQALESVWLREVTERLPDLVPGPCTGAMMVYLALCVKAWLLGVLILLEAPLEIFPLGFLLIPQDSLLCSLMTTTRAAEDLANLWGTLIPVES